MVFSDCNGILQSTAFTQGGVLFIIFDEGETSAGCCNDAVGGQVATLVISPFAKRGFQSKTPETHYGLLRTIEEVWGLPFLGEASKSTAMTEYFMRQERSAYGSQGPKEQVMHTKEKELCKWKVTSS